ncbi:MAG: NADH-quinone oxidoreductase subunit J [Deltaproteobacteria bacterium]|nr:NADH-quinone oxidoreductase subunit J [Deltaproteobacteria bacterium]
MHEVAFFALAALTVASAGAVALSKNIIHSTVALLGTFTGVAGMYVTLSADFLAAVQILVYVGGTLTLILFAVMLTSKIDEIRISNASVGLVGAVPLVLVVLAALGKVAGTTEWASRAHSQMPATARLGHAFLGEYLLPFELASIVMLAALIGAVVLARRAVRRKGEIETTGGSGVGDA